MELRKYSLMMDQERHPVLEQENMWEIEGSFENPQSTVSTINSALKLTEMAEPHTILLALDAKCRPLGVFDVPEYMDIRGILTRALCVGACGIVIFHNKLYDELMPSEDERTVTDRLFAACEIVGITFLDHIIVGETQFFSFIKEAMEQKNGPSLEN